MLDWIFTAMYIIVIHCFTPRGVMFSFCQNTIFIPVYLFIAVFVSLFFIYNVLPKNRIKFEHTQHFIRSPESDLLVFLFVYQLILKLIDQIR